MARKNPSAIDKARQAIGKAITGSIKSSRKSIKKKITQVQRNRESDFVAKWRALKKLGLIDTRNNPSKKHLTSRLKTKINKEFFAFQSEGKYVRGKVVRPLQREVIDSARGARVKYTLSDNFKFLRTKKKTPVKTGVIKTKNGYIIQKKAPDSKIKITKDGDLIQTTGTERVRTKAYKGDSILELYAAIKENRLKMKPKELLALRKWGGQNNVEMFERDSLDMFIQLIDQYAKQMSSKVFRDFIDVSEVMFIRG